MPRRSPMASRLIIRWGMPQAGNRAGKTINSLQCWDQIAERGLWTSAGGTVTTFRGHSNPNQNTRGGDRPTQMIESKSSVVEFQAQTVPMTSLRNVPFLPASTALYHPKPSKDCTHACTVGHYRCPIIVARAPVRGQ